MGSSLRLSCAMLHDGVIRRSEDVDELRMKSEMSRAVVRDGVMVRGILWVTEGCWAVRSVVWWMGLKLH